MNKIIYLDNAATSFPKPRCVIREVRKCITEYCGNPGRSSHSLALRSSEKIYEARENIARLLNYDHPENIIFTMNATHGLNIAIKGIINSKMHAIISDLEHNSVIRPLKRVLNQYGGEISVYNSDMSLNESIKPLIKEDTGALISTLSSNVTGKAIAPYILSEISLNYNLPLIIDASQYTGHLPLDLSKCHFDALVSPGHKALFGLQGSGFIIINSKRLQNTIIEGGSGFDTLNADMPLLLPERYEAGTPATPAIVGLSRGIEYILDYGIDNIKLKINELTSRTEDILSDFKSIRIFGASNGIVSFLVEGQPSSVTSGMLSNLGIATRSGLHCAPLIHRKLGTIETGLVRISFSIFNTKREIDKLYKSLKEITK